MKKLSLMTFFLIIVAIKCVNAMDLFDAIKSTDLDVRANAFNSMIALAPVSNRIEYDCKFKVSDRAAAKTAVIDLLRLEDNFDFDNFYRHKYSINFTKEELRQHVNEKNVETYLYAKEGFGEYLAELQAFVDSCEDERAVDLLPGEKTLNAYPDKSVSAILSKLSGVGIGRNESKAYLVRQMGGWAKKYRKQNTNLYDKVKSRLTLLVEDSDLGNVSAETMGEIGDLDFVPLLDKVAQYPDTRGKIKVGRGGRKKIYPIALEAKKALRKIKKFSETESSGILTSSTTKDIPQ